MILRWVYNFWNLLLKTIAILAVVLVVLGGILFAVLQLPQSKNYVKNQLVNTFNNQFEGTLQVERIGGLLPLNVDLYEVQLTSNGRSEPDLSLDRAEVSVNLWALLQRNIDINSLELYQPSANLYIVNGETNLSRIFQEKEATGTSPQQTSNLLYRFDIYAPEISIRDGNIRFDESVEIPEQFGVSTPNTITEIHSDIFIESTERQFFIDILNLQANAPTDVIGELQLSGQFFNDGHFLEMNGIQFSHNSAELDFTAEAYPVDFFAQDLTEQLKSATYMLNIERSTLRPLAVRELLPEIPLFPGNLDFAVELEGTLDSLFVDRVELAMGESSLLASGLLENITTNDFLYDFNLENIVLTPSETEWMAEQTIGTYDLSIYETKILRGSVNGSLQNTIADLSLETEAGSLTLESEITYAEIPGYSVNINADSLDISTFAGDTLYASILNGSISAEGEGFDRNATVNATIDLENSSYNYYNFSNAEARLNFANQQLDYSISLAENGSDFEADGKFSLADDNYVFSTEGIVRRMDLAKFIDNSPYESSEFSGSFSGNVQGKDIDDLYGRLSLEISESTINGDTLRPHQLYVDIDSPDQENRQLRFTSSFFDGEMTGDINPTQIEKMAMHWGDYLKQRFYDEFLFAEDIVFSPLHSDDDFELQLNGEMTIKDLGLLRHYYPEMPEMASNAAITFSTIANRDELTIESTFEDGEFLYENSYMRDGNATISGIFSYEDELKSNSSLNISFDAETINLFDNYDLEGISLTTSMQNDTITVTQNIDTISDDLSYNSSSVVTLFDDRFELHLGGLYLGNPSYEWETIGDTKIIYTEDEKLSFENFSIASDTDLFEINGTFSNDPDDSAEFIIQNFELSRVSDLIAGRIGFSGTVDGSFITRTLTDIPSIQGDIDIKEGRINNRVIGDVSLNSSYNSEEDRFDTDIHIYTDPERYASYLEENDNVGHDIHFNGFVKTPNSVDPDEDLFYFDADLNQIDMWIVTVMVPNVITDMEGSSSGTGFLRGRSAQDYDYSATFDVTDVYGKPLFTNVDYTVDGELIFNREDGLLFNDITLTDTRDGTGTLYGQIDLNDFNPGTRFDLTLDLNNLHFMNNLPDPNVPFYSSLYGTGQAQITGTSEDPFLRTSETVELSTLSRIAIPLTIETEFEQDRRFIQFVDSFNITDPAAFSVEEEDNSDDEEEEVDLSFLEVFSMDVQFAASEEVNVQLIFDPVTNEVLNATGGGQVRILLEDQDVSMFGRFNIESGDYQFVGGDIFTRRFTLEEGGNISWQGELADADLDIDASYRARPNASSLLGSQATESFSRIPIDLILEIGGTITSVENNFFFRIPSGIDGTLDPLVSAQINRINQSEDEKLIQSFALLLTGNFIPTSEVTAGGLGEGVTGASAIVNPLISSQIISPLLSDQINSILSDDIVFDVDVNITQNRLSGPDEFGYGVDLDMALRLFNDRFIIRREGQVAGQQSNIGDLGATYRINRIFSVTAFHRQDFSTTGRSSEDELRGQTQEMNGVGVEAEFQFNTWQNLRARISNSFRKLFGLKEKEEDTVTEDDLQQLATEPQ
ncbi:MAG: AsmA family protein [Balneolaceae bacterium]